MYTTAQKRLILEYLESVYEKQAELQVEFVQTVDPKEILSLMELIMDTDTIQEQIETLENTKSDISHTHSDKADISHTHSDKADVSHTHTELHTHPNKIYIDNINQNLMTTSKPAFFGLRSADYAFPFGGKPNANAILIITTEGNATQSELTVYNKADWSNSSRLRIIVNQNSISLDSSNTGTGILQDVVISFNSAEVCRITSNGIVKAKGFEIY